jgi:hypothetical protein
MIELKKVRIKDKTYYLDERLKQLRNVKNPHDFIDLNDFEVLYYSKKKLKTK